jgi:hypothetical protein
MTDRLYFTYERMSPFVYREPHDIKTQLMKKFCYEYKNKPLSDISLSTEFVLKSLKPKDTTDVERPLLKYKIVSEDWEYTRTNKNIIFNPNMFRFFDIIEHNYE